MKFILEFDDLHWAEPENCLDTIHRYISTIPSIKISLFTVPNLRGKPIYTSKSWCDNVRALVTIGRIQLARHGFDHSIEEFKDLDFEAAYKKLIIGDYYFERAGLKCERVFRAPYWALSEPTVRALNALNYSHLYNHEEKSNLDHLFNKKVVRYNWNLADDEPYITDKTDTIVAHGHTHNVCGNGIMETFEKVVEFLQKQDNLDFRFANEY